ncbi:hypothetical protein DL770_008570 [Monosporascus sp. CRB-9-2]|nr:hypothetical protein DL770_008570 [Monosporascus sp. CRB-9-2]
MPHVPRSAAAASLSSGAIVGIGVPSAVILFVVFALLLTRLAKWQDRRRRAAIGPASGVSLLGVADGEAAGPKRLRKKSSVEGGVGGGRRSAEMADILDIPLRLPVLPPVLSRPGSFTLGPLIGDGAEGENGNGIEDANPRSSADAVQTPKYTTPIRRSLQDVRKASWIDEDALHGPRMASPEKRNKGNNKKKKSKLFFGGLGRSLSERLSTWRRDEVTEIIGSPTLPCTDEGGECGTTQRQVRDSHLAKAQGRLAGVLQRDMDADAVSPQSGRAEGPRKVCVQHADPAEHGLAHHGLVVTLPSDVVHIPKQRDSGAALEAAQQQTALSPQKVPRHPAKSTADVELAGILRSTAERLQQDGGSRSMRRQTMMVMPQGGDSSTVHVAVMLGGRGNVDQDNYLTVASSRTARRGVFDNRSTGSSPAKSQKSAPAVMSSSSSSYAELEGCGPKPPPQQQSSSAPQGPTAGHRQQVSHVFPASMIPEPESLVACSSRRISDSEVQTAFSSPSRRNRDPAMPPSRENQQDRPYSAASAESSALSTLYSEDEAIAMAQARAQLSPPISELRLDDATPTSGRGAFMKEACYSPYHVFDARPTKAASGHDRSPKFTFEDGESTRPRRARRETMPDHPSRIPSPQPQPPRSAAGARVGPDKKASLPLPNSSLQFTTYPYDTRDDPFTALEVPPKNPARLSRVFPPLPVELAADEAGHKDSTNGGGCGGTADGLPPVCVMKTAEPLFLTTQGGRADVAATVVPPLQQALRPMMSSPTLGTGTVELERCATVSSVLSSEAGHSSIYDSGAEMRADTASRSSASLVTVPTAESRLTEEDYTLRAAGLRPDNNESPDAASSGRESRTVLRASENRGSVETSATARVQKIQLQQSPQTAAESEPPRLRESPASDTGSRYSQDTLPPLATPTKTNNLRVVSAVAELRRMNSQVSSASGHSATTNTDTEPGSPTLPAFRGGGCSPGSRNKGGGKNYLALGGGPDASPTGNGAAGKSAVEDSPSRSGGNDRSGKGGLQTRSIAISGRARRGTMVLSGVDARTTAGLEQLRRRGGVLREGNGGNVGADRARQRQESPAKQIETRASRLAHEEREFLGRPGVESPGLYDEKGFLRGSPFRGNVASPFPRRV